MAGIAQVELVHPKHSEQDGQHPCHDFTLLTDITWCGAASQIDAYRMVGVLVDLEIYVASLNRQSLLAPLAAHKGVAIAIVAGYDSAVFLNGVVEDLAFQSWFLRCKPSLGLFTYVPRGSPSPRRAMIPL